MQNEPWGDEYACGTESKFIALEVPDNDDDYDSECESTATRAASRRSSGGANQLRTPSHTSTRGSGSAAAAAGATKRWSLISNSSKKRWSTMSFASDERSRGQAVHAAQAALATTPTGSVASSATSHKRRSVGSPSPALKRSSTGASLRNMLGKIGLQDDTKENRAPAASPATTAKPNKSTKTATPAKPTSPLQQLDANIYNRVNRANRTNQRNSYMNASPSLDNVSVFSASSQSSTSSKWKFWKKKTGDDFYADSISPDLPDATTDPTAHAYTLNTRRSHSSLKHKSSHSSLTSLKRLSSHRNSCTSDSISLPMPDQASRDKLRNKLRNSSSLLSLNSTVITEEYDQFQLSQLLEICQQPKAVPIESAVPNWGSLKRVSTHVFKGSDSVFKVLPLGQDDFTHSKHIRLKELQLLRLFTGTPGFTQLLACHLTLIHDEPTLVCELRHGGTPLSQLCVESCSEALSIWWQCVVILYAGESKFQFEHRDLQLEHVLVDPNGNVTLCDYKLARAASGAVVYYTRLDHPSFFQGRGDRRYEVYAAMRAWCSDSWLKFAPRTNLLWLHYLGTQLLDRTRSRVTNADDHVSHAQLTRLVSLLDPRRRRHTLFRRTDDIATAGDLLRLRP
ncbi:LAMI_0D06502g1_1 [Lachancea mirantina]|uniref:non-specific serine/threonine protein kinase n=1 Tax=Lachancea mirantina TaxID=1230905 RepID=A0A1G4JBQ5_9SACH|nr:LAMI_0D06502g1_1 [Lachancea mirantina]